MGRSCVEGQVQSWSRPIDLHHTTTSGEGHHRLFEGRTPEAEVGGYITGEGEKILHLTLKADHTKTVAQGANHDPAACLHGQRVE